MKEITIEKDTIHVEKKNVYGNELIYPVCERAKRFAILTGQKTLSDGAISATGEVIIDDYILPTEPIVDYKTRFSGLTHEDLDPTESPHHLVNLRTAYLKLRHLVGDILFTISMI